MATDNALYFWIKVHPDPFEVGQLFSKGTDPHSEPILSKGTNPHDTAVPVPPSLVSPDGLTMEVAVAATGVDADPQDPKPLATASGIYATWPLAQAALSGDEGQAWLADAVDHFPVRIQQDLGEPPGAWSKTVFVWFKRVQDAADPIDPIGGAAKAGLSDRRRSLAIEFTDVREAPDSRWTASQPMASREIAAAALQSAEGTAWLVRGSTSRCVLLQIDLMP